MTSASRYVTSASRYQSRSSMYIQGLIPWSSTELAEAVPIVRMRTIGDCVRTSWPRGYKAWVQSQTQNKAQWLAACGHVSTSSQSLSSILSLRMNSSFITWMPGRLGMLLFVHFFSIRFAFTCTVSLRNIPILASLCISMIVASTYVSFVLSA